MSRCTVRVDVSRGPGNRQCNYTHCIYAHGRRDSGGVKPKPQKYRSDFEVDHRFHNRVAPTTCCRGASTELRSRHKKQPLLCAPEGGCLSSRHSGTTRTTSCPGYPTQCPPPYGGGYGFSIAAPGLLVFGPPRLRTIVGMVTSIVWVGWGERFARPQIGDRRRTRQMNPLIARSRRVQTDHRLVRVDTSSASLQMCTPAWRAILRKKVAGRNSAWRDRRCANRRAHAGRMPPHHRRASDPALGLSDRRRKRPARRNPRCRSSRAAPLGSADAGIGDLHVDVLTLVAPTHAESDNLLTRAGLMSRP